MKMWALGGIVTMIIMGTSGVAYAQEEECPMGRPTQMVRGINSVVGVSAAGPIAVIIASEASSVFLSWLM